MPAALASMPRGRVRRGPMRVSSTFAPRTEPVMVVATMGRNASPVRTGV